MGIYIGQNKIGMVGSSSTSQVDTIQLQQKEVNPAPDQIVVLPDTGYNGLSKVIVNAIPTATQATPTISINEENGEITATSTQSAGWVAAGTTYAQPLQLTTQPQPETPITPTEQEQIAVEAHTYTLGEIKVGAIPSTYIGTGVTRKQTETYSPSPTDRTISSGQYLAGDQIIKAINLQEKEITENGTVTPDTGYDGLSRVEVNVTPSGSSAPTIKTLTLTPTSNSLTLSFSSLDAEPKFFSVTPIDNITLATTRYIVGIEYDGTILKTSYSYRQSSIGGGYISYDTSNVSQSYSNGTLTLASTSANSTGYFRSGVDYQLTYIY